MPESQKAPPLPGRMPEARGLMLVEPFARFMDFGFFCFGRDQLCRCLAFGL